MWALAELPLTIAIHSTCTHYCKNLVFFPAPDGFSVWAEVTTQGICLLLPCSICLEPSQLTSVLRPKDSGLVWSRGGHTGVPQPVSWQQGFMMALILATCIPLVLHYQVRFYLVLIIQDRVSLHSTGWSGTKLCYAAYTWTYVNLHALPPPKAMIIRVSHHTPLKSNSNWVPALALPKALLLPPLIPVSYSSSCPRPFLESSPIALTTDSF